MWKEKSRTAGSLVKDFVLFSEIPFALIYVFEMNQNNVLVYTRSESFSFLSNKIIFIYAIENLYLVSGVLSFTIENLKIFV